ncbi:sulfite exporter TauE/SafE family protein [Halococcus agarilyticus]|uniref:sulfite exporter TauE/SafE family protein n=1 Tax=Halococcus agarilyticus TaxID=1232219 RepID=UPI000677E9BA|nr:sulfite exporter TauE/SafE family protein [Halococcus agarilyticus]
MSLTAAALTGGALGVYHALEADHLAAVATLVEDDGRDRHSGVVGVSWGVGHTIPVVALGVGFLLLGVTFPEQVTKLFEIVVGVVLVGLGVRMLVGVFGTETHEHDEQVHSHFRVGPVRLGAHHHLDGDSLLVGVVHGFAGSGALVVAMVSTAPATDTGLAFLGAFSLLSILTMGGVSMLWNHALARGFRRYLETGAAVLGIGVGLLLLAEQFTGLAVL